MNPLTNVRNVTKMNDRELELGYVNTNKSWHRQYKNSAWIFIGGLNFDLTEGDIICVFSQFGEVVNIDLIRDAKTGKSRGFAFLCYEDQRSTNLAVDNLNGVKVAGRITRVDHVENYKAPKVTGEEAGGAQKWEGCGPEVMMRLEPSANPPPEPTPEKKKKSKKEKKEKKEKKKKKKKKKRESSDSESSESTSESPQRPSSSREQQRSVPRSAENSSQANRRPRPTDHESERAGPSRLPQRDRSRSRSPDSPHWRDREPRSSFNTDQGRTQQSRLPSSRDSGRRADGWYRDSTRHRRSRERSRSPADRRR